MAPCWTPKPRFPKPIWMRYAVPMKPASRPFWSPDAATALRLPIAESLGFDLWIISSNGAVTRSTHGEAFHRDLMPQATALKLCRHMRDFRNYSVITFDRDAYGRHRLREPRSPLRRDPALDGEERALHRVRQSDRTSVDSRIPSR